ncbi:MAG: hypothetical protein WAJ88_08755 [Pseudolabrys sp.]
MKRLVLTTVALGILTAPAFAQKGDSDPLTIMEREKQQEAKQLDQQYKRAMERSRKQGDTATARTDPWANMRAPNDGKR